MWARVVQVNVAKHQGRAHRAVDEVLAVEGKIIKAEAGEAFIGGCGGDKKNSWKSLAIDQKCHVPV